MVLQSDLDHRCLFELPCNVCTVNEIKEIKSSTSSNGSHNVRGERCLKARREGVVQCSSSVLHCSPAALFYIAAPSAYAGPLDDIRQCKLKQ